MSVDGDEPNACVSAERNVECYLRARHYPCRNNSFSKQHFLVGVHFLDPEDRHVDRMRHIQIPALQRIKRMNSECDTRSCAMWCVN